VRVSMCTFKAIDHKDADIQHYSVCVSTVYRVGQISVSQLVA